MSDEVVETHMWDWSGVTSKSNTGSLTCMVMQNDKSQTREQRHFAKGVTTPIPALELPIVPCLY